MLFRFKKHNAPENFLKDRKVKKINPLLIRHKLRLRSQNLNRTVKVEVYLPSETTKYRGTLLLNDGQDREQLHLVKHFSILLSKVEVPNIGIVTMYADENRMQEYGVAGHPDFKNRGKWADRYTNFIVQELTPFLQAEYGLMNPEHNNVFAGFSMGGLSALDITWNNPQLFKIAGIFSGSLWWRTKNTGTPEDDSSRIMHRIIREGKKRDDLKFWFQTGTKDETRDRNKNGVIDSIDDTLDLIKELKTLGYSDRDIVYEEISGGHHNFNTWSKIFPNFLKWAFPVKR